MIVVDSSVVVAAFATWREGNGARGVLASPDGPVRSVVVAIVDAVELTTPSR